MADFPCLHYGASGRCIDTTLQQVWISIRCGGSCHHEETLDEKYIVAVSLKSQDRYRPRATNVCQKNRQCVVFDSILSK